MALKKIKRKTQEPEFNKTEMENTQLEFLGIKQQLKILTKRETELKGRLDKYMTHALKPDSKGHYLFTTLSDTGERIHLQKQARKKISLNFDKTKKFAEETNLPLIGHKEVIASDVTDEQVLEVLAQHAPHLLDNIEYADEKEVERLVRDETISMEDFEQLCDINITYAMTFIDDKKLQEEVEKNATTRNGKNL